MVVLLIRVNIPTHEVVFNGGDDPLFIYGDMGRVLSNVHLHRCQVRVPSVLGLPMSHRKFYSRSQAHIGHAWYTQKNADNPDRSPDYSFQETRCQVKRATKSKSLLSPEERSRRGHEALVGTSRSASLPKGFMV